MSRTPCAWGHGIFTEQVHGNTPLTRFLHDSICSRNEPTISIYQYLVWMIFNSFLSRLSFVTSDLSMNKLVSRQQTKIYYISSFNSSFASKNIEKIYFGIDGIII